MDFFRKLVGSDIGFIDGVVSKFDGMTCICPKCGNKHMEKKGVVDLYFLKIDKFIFEELREIEDVVFEAEIVCITEDNKIYKIIYDPIKEKFLKEDALWR